MNDFILSFETAFDRTFIPRGCRRTRTEYPVIKGHGVVPRIKPDEAQVAFRIRYPVVSRFGVPFGVDNERRSTLELLVHRDSIWWPYGGSLYSPWPDKYAGERLSARFTATEWGESIARDRDLLRLVPDGATAADTETESRCPPSDRRDEVVARVQSAFVQHYRVFGKHLYVRGGVPLYAQWKDGSRRIMTVTSSRWDRTMGAADLYVPPADSAGLRTRQAFYEGRFWAPDLGEAVKNRLTGSQFACPEIEICIPELIQDDLLRDVRIDALFEEVMQLLSRFIFRALAAPFEMRRSKPAALEFETTIRRKFRDAAQPKTDSYATSVSRVDALRSILGCELRLPKHGVQVSKLGACVRAFEDIERRYPREKLAAEDSKILEDLGSDAWLTHQCNN